MSVALMPREPISSLNGKTLGAGDALAIPDLPAFRNGCAISWQMTYAVAPSAVTATLESTIDGTNWFTLDTTTSVDGELRTVTNVGALAVRINISSMTGGSGPADLVMVL